jgi:hypothetical protein
MSQFHRIGAGGVAVAAFLALSGCAPGGSGLSGALNNIVSRVTAPYALLNLSSGAIEYRMELSDVQTNVAYRTTTMVFRRVGSGTTECFVGIFEVTQAQWSRIDGSTPWMNVHTAVVPAQARNDNRPVYGLSYDDLSTGVTAYRPAGSARLAIPSLAQWHLAAGTSSDWTWGSAASREQLDANAWVYETTNGAGGPRAAGSLAATNLGFYDLHGNVWEWTSDTTIHGGSWRDAASSSRINTEVDENQGIDSGLEHALIGARLVLIP